MAIRVSRNFSLAVQYVLDEWLPPILRDSRWVMYLPMKLLFGTHTREMMDFKDGAFRLSEAEFSGVYVRTEVPPVVGPVQLHSKSISACLVQASEHPG